MRSGGASPKIARRKMYSGLEQVSQELLMGLIPTVDVTRMIQMAICWGMVGPTNRSKMKSK